VALVLVLGVAAAGGTDARTVALATKAQERQGANTSDQPGGVNPQALEAASGAKIYPISAPIGEGVEPLLDKIVELLGDAARQAQEDAEPARPWSPL